MEFWSIKKLEKYLLRLTIQEKIMFGKRLSALINAGIPIVLALRMIERQASSKAARLIFSSLVYDVETGKSLSQAMQKFSKVFGEFSLNVVRLGELGENLQENLNYMAMELKKQQELKRKMLGALAYPIFIVIATLGMAVLLTTYVFPKILPVFKSLRVPLPWTTRALIFISDLILNHGLIIVAVSLVVLLGSIYLSKQLFYKVWMHRNILRLPLLGQLIRCYHIANFSRSLGLLLKSDMRIVDSLNIAALTTNSQTYKAQFKVLSQRLLRGENLSSNLKRNPKIFPSLLVQMVEVGETTGSLSESLIYISEIYEDELNNLTTSLSSAIEPLLMVVMGMVIGFIAVSIITPIYGITQNLHP